MSELPVREMVLYKHGVGFFVRGGEINTNTVSLTFRKDEINDVLKSLTVFDRAGGQVIGVRYQTPMDIGARLASSSIVLSDNSSQRDLLRDLRGRQTTMTIATAPGSLETHSGRVVGIDDMDTHTREENQHGPTVTLLADSGEVLFFPLASLKQIQVKDTQSARDLSYFLDTSMTEDDRRTVEVQLSDGQHDLFVAYVAPSPTWRVSYRIVAETDDTGQTGQALVQGWGLFDNRLEEDLDGVRLTLVAGQPISFIYDLYASRIPERPVIEDEARIAPGPVEFAGEAVLMAESSPLPEPKRRARGGAKLGLVSDEMSSFTESFEFEEDMSTPAFRREIRQHMQQTEQAETKDAAEFFQYIVTAPVSVKRGESALVPIINQTVNYQRELLYNNAKLPDHPVVSLRFDNNTGLTFERGPVTVVEDDDYKGDAIIPFTTDGQSVYVAYAVELGIHVKEAVHTHHEFYNANIQDDYIVQQTYVITRTTYTIENKTHRAAVVTLEAPVEPDAALFNTPTPDVETTTERRWRIPVDAHQKATFVRQIRHLIENRKLIQNIAALDLDRYLQAQTFSGPVLDQLRTILEIQDAIRSATQRSTRLQTDLKALYEKQKHLRENMQALNPQGDEAAFRKRIVQQLEESQDAVDTLSQEQDRLNQQIEANRQQIDEIIQALGKRA